MSLDVLPQVKGVTPFPAISVRGCRHCKKDKSIRYVRVMVQETSEEKNLFPVSSLDCPQCRQFPGVKHLFWGWGCTCEQCGCDLYLPINDLWYPYQEEVVPTIPDYPVSCPHCLSEIYLQRCG